MLRARVPLAALVAAVCLGAIVTLLIVFAVGGFDGDKAQSAATAPSVDPSEQPVLGSGRGTRAGRRSTRRGAGRSSRCSSTSARASVADERRGLRRRREQGSDHHELARRDQLGSREGSADGAGSTDRSTSSASTARASPRHRRLRPVRRHRDPALRPQPPADARGADGRLVDGPGRRPGGRDRGAVRPRPSRSRRASSRRSARRSSRRPPSAS